MAFTNIRISIESCPACGKPHTNFHVKRDSKGVEYIICGGGKTAKRVNVEYRNPNSKNPYQPKAWTKLDG